MHRTSHRQAAVTGVYIYAVGVESCRNRLTLEGSARLRPKTKPRRALSGAGQTAHAFVSRFGLTRAPHESPTGGGYRRIHIRLRGRVLCNPPRLKGFRSASAQNKAAQCTLGSWANGACVRLSLRGKARLLPRAASTVRSAILRRRNTASLSRLRPVAHHANRSLAVPLRLLLAHAPLARPSAMARFSS